MKLLFDQNLSPRLVRQLADLYPGSLHVRDLGLQEADDLVVWRSARERELLIVSKDSVPSAQLPSRASAQGSLAAGGERTVLGIEALLRRHFETLQEFAAHREAAFLALA